MEPNKPEKGSLVSAFRKAVLVVVAGVALTAGASQEAKAQSTVAYGNQGVTATQNYQQQKPWANDPAYQQRIQTLAQQQELQMIQAEQRARASLARIQQQRTQALARHSDRISNMKDRRGTNALDYANVAAQWHAQEQRFRASTAQVQIDLQNLQLRQETAMTRLVENLDKQYARQYPSGASRSVATPARAVTTAPAADPDQRMQDDMDKARRDAMQKIYKQYLDGEVRAGRIPDSAEDFFKKREAQQRQPQAQTPRPGN